MHPSTQESGSTVTEAQQSLATSEGVRARKHRETAQRIHLAALEFAERDTTPHAPRTAATVGEIAAAAGVSRRTFFRYYNNREDAVLAGHARALAGATALPLVVTSATETTQAIEHLFDAILAAEGSPELAEHRRVGALLRTDRQLHAHAATQDAAIAAVLRDRIRVQLPRMDTSDLELDCELSVLVWRHGWQRWSAQADVPDAETPAESHRRTRARFHSLIARADS